MRICDVDGHLEKLATKREERKGGREGSWRAPGEGRSISGWESQESIPTCGKNPGGSEGLCQKGERERSKAPEEAQTQSPGGALRHLCN